MNFGEIFMDTESFNELKQASGFGVPWQNFFIAEILVSKEDVLVEEEMLRAYVVEKKKIVQRRIRESFKLVEAITADDRCREKQRDILLLRD